MATITEHEPARAPRSEKVVRVAAWGLIAGLGVFFVGFAVGSGGGLAAAFEETVGRGAKVLDAGLRTTFGGHDPQLTQIARYDGQGVTVDRTDDGALVLMAGHFGEGTEVRLVRRDGSLVRRWPTVYSADFDGRGFDVPDSAMDLHGTLIEPDGSVVYNYEYNGTIKRDLCGAVVWRLTHRTHHSVERAEGGGYWIPGQRFIERADAADYPPFHRMEQHDWLAEDTILRVSETGEIVEAVSAVRVLYESGLGPLISATGKWFEANRAASAEIVHLNKIAELPAAYAAAYPTLEAGDLALSFRQRNLVAVVRPGEWRVVWHGVGPWLRQHDPEFRADGRISVFNNNTFAYNFDRHYFRPRDLAEPTGNIVAVDPASGETEVVYGDGPGESFHTHIRGKHEVLDGGGLLVTEFEGGRVFETDASGEIVWEYVNNLDDETAGEISEARVLPADFFEVEDWSCPTS
ncbi:MAG: arylsulfotransferase family protein [Paracoccaceae bacterium]